MLTICQLTMSGAKPALPHPSTLLYWRPMTDEKGFFVQCDEEFEAELCDADGNFPTL